MDQSTFFNKNTTISLLRVFDMCTKLLDFCSKQIRVCGTSGNTNSLFCSLDHNIYKPKKDLFMISCELKNILLTTSQPCSRTRISGFVIRICHFKLISRSRWSPCGDSSSIPFSPPAQVPVLLPASTVCLAWTACPGPTHPLTINS